MQHIMLLTPAFFIIEVLYFSVIRTYGGSIMNDTIQVTTIQLINTGGFGAYARKTVLFP